MKNIVADVSINAATHKPLFFLPIMRPRRESDCVQSPQITKQELSHHVGRSGGANGGGRNHVPERAAQHQNAPQERRGGREKERRAERGFNTGNLPSGRGRIGGAVAAQLHKRRKFNQLGPPANGHARRNKAQRRPRASQPPDKKKQVSASAKKFAILFASSLSY